MVISVLKFQSRTYEVVPEPTWELAGRIAFLTHHHERNEVSDEPLPSERESNELSDRLTSRANYSTSKWKKTFKQFFYETQSNGPRILDRAISEIFAVECPLIMPPPEGSGRLHIPRPV